MRIFSVAKNIIIDTCFWIALYDKEDEYHEIANILSEEIEIHNWLVPWPTLYETLNTRFVRRKNWITLFNFHLAKDFVYKIDDNTYRDAAYNSVFQINFMSRNNLSLVDLVIHEMLRDVNLKIDAILTFNEGDFFEVCNIKNIEILN